MKNNGQVQRPEVMIVSDSIGETAEFVVKAAIVQFDSSAVDVKRISHVKSSQQIGELVRSVDPSHTVIVYTLVQTELREVLEKEVREYGVAAVDIMGPVIHAFSKIMPISPRLEPGLVRRLDENYHHRTNAVEFAVKYDDGKDPRGILLSDVVLIGVSRTSKTPLSMYLAYRGLKVSNFPLIPEVKVPKELFAIPSQRLFGLVIDPELLIEIRRQRINALGLKADSSYASMTRILQEMEHADQVMRKLGCRVFDVSRRAIEEIATVIMNALKEEGYNYGR